MSTNENVNSYQEFRSWHKLSGEELEEKFPDECYLIFYPTQSHEQSNKTWWTCGLELKALIRASKEFDDNLRKALL